jgi:hypothetical protein
MRSETERWPVRPMMSDFCGLALAKDVWFVCEVKNSGAACPDFKLGTPPEQPCQACRWRSPGTGPARDEAELAQVRELTLSAAYSGQGGDGGLERFIASVSARKRYELGQALRFGSFAPEPPDYLATCGRYSGAHSFVPACVQNPSERCGGFEPVEVAVLTRRTDAGLTRPAWRR